MFRPIRTFCTLGLLAGTAVLLEGCGQKTIYSDMYSPKRSRFVANVERTTPTELPPETTTTTTTTVFPEASPLQPPADMGVPPPAEPPVIPGMEPAPAAPLDAAPPGMDAAPAPDAAPPAMDAAPAVPPADPAPIQ
jgi:hypothetical protein